MTHHISMYIYNVAILYIYISIVTLLLTTASPYGGWVPGPMKRSTASMAGNTCNPAMSPHTLPRHPSHWISQCTKEGWSHWRIQWKNKGREEGVVKYSANANQLTLPRYSKCHANISVALSQHCAKHVTWLRTADHLPFCTAFLVNLVKLHLTASCSFSQSQYTMVHTI